MERPRSRACFASARLKVKDLGMIVRLTARIQKAVRKNIVPENHRHREMIVFTGFLSVIETARSFNFDCQEYMCFGAVFQAVRWILPYTKKHDEKYMIDAVPSIIRKPQ
jgi:hypothetical protein